MKNLQLPALLDADGQWNEARRQELLALFAHEVFGEAPTGDFGTRRIVRHVEQLPDLGTKEIWDIIFDTPAGAYAFPLYLYLPAGTAGPAPVALYIGNRSRKAQPLSLPAGMTMQDIMAVMKDVAADMPMPGAGAADMAAAAPQPCDLENDLELDNWPVRELLARGFATAAYYTEDLEPDCCTDGKQGVIHLFDDVENRGKERWSAIAAWAFGASRAIDCLAADVRFDAQHIAVIGHSRGGKTALWCAANDPRVACCYANNSGCTGAAISRIKRGERLLQINTMFPYWFCENYKAYNGQEDALPFDQHMLLALVAPRPLYLASATEDIWADPNAEFLGAVYAAPAYTVCGVSALACDALPAPETPSHNGTIGYHVRKGPHALTREDWLRFCDFWKKHW